MSPLVYSSTRQDVEIIGVCSLECQISKSNEFKVELNKVRYRKKVDCIIIYSDHNQKRYSNESKSNQI